MSMAGGADSLPTAEVLMAEARTVTGIDRVDEAAYEPLSVLVRSLKREGQLHAAGVDEMRSRLVRILSNRLRMQRDFDAHPEIQDQRVEAPVFICGMARTGSTKLQKLLAASGDFNWLAFWQVLNPALWTGDADESPQPRIDDVDAFAKRFDAASPETKFGHAFETHEPEEESFILEHSLRTPTFLGWAPINGYLEWLATQDMRRQFEQLRDTLKYLQWQQKGSSPRRWVLKSPLYSGLEAQLLETFPDAKLVMTHRSPEATIASGLRLLENFYKPYSSASPDPIFYIHGQAHAAEAHLQARAKLTEGTFHDVDFKALVSDVRGVVEQVYSFAGVPLGQQSIARILAWEAANPQHRRGRHTYSLGDYGLTAAQIRELFTGYERFLADRFAPRR